MWALTAASVPRRAPRPLLAAAAAATGGGGPAPQTAAALAAPRPLWRLGAAGPRGGGGGVGGPLAAALGRLAGGPAQLAAPCVVQSRGFYWPRKNWWPWRQRLMKDRQASLRKKRHIWPRQHDPDERPIFYPKIDGNQLAFREKGVRIGCKRLLDYCRLIKGRQLQDGIDWVESLGRMQSEPILKLMRKAMQEGIDRYKLDPARIFIFDAQPQRGKFVKELRKHARGNYGTTKRPRNYFLLRVREMPLEEYFHRIYVFNKVPRSLSSDMRLALHEKRVSPQMQKEWAPYLTATTRHRHRMTLKWMDSTRQFNYYEARREWIQRYKANLLRASAEAREARGLAPLPMAD